MGANIGTTERFMLLAFGFGKFSISDYSLPLIGIEFLYILPVKIH